MLTALALLGQVFSSQAQQQCLGFQMHVADSLYCLKYHWQGASSCSEETSRLYVCVSKFTLPLSILGQSFQLKESKTHLG